MTLPAVDRRSQATYSESVERLTISPDVPDQRAIVRSGAIVLAGGLVAFPTDTFYGLAADPRREDAVARVFRVKGRAFTAALPLIAADVEQVRAASSGLSGLTLRLAHAFWPGPLTLVVDAAPAIVPAVHGGTHTVAIRVPGHLVARQLAGVVGFPVVSTSANRSGEPAAADADAVATAIGDMVDVVLDGGATPGAEPSTIVDARGAVPVLIRPGAVAFSRVLEAS
jgi:L-threonylcarbamoyladenylate synthase